MPETYVLVHGAWHGGWCWDRLAPLLRADGSHVFTPTLTGLGDRAHQLTPDVGLDTFVDDVCAVFSGENLTDVVLVGHSFAGLVISGVADSMPQRIARLVYLDAMIVQPGRCAFDDVPPHIAAARRADALAQGGLAMPVPPPAAFGVLDPADAAWLAPLLRPQPIKPYEDVVKLAHPLGNGLPRHYIACTAPPYAVMAPVREWVRRQPDWTYVEIETGHDAMVTAPQRLADLLRAAPKTVQRTS